MFISLEGPEGGGKSSHVKPLVDFLRQRGCQVCATYEPGGTRISDQVRDILKNIENTEMHPRTEILLFCAARAQLVEQVIQPALAQGAVVISDRYADSTLAYQGYGHGVDLSVLRQLLNFATGNRMPDFTLLLDIETDMGLNRKRAQAADWNRFEDYELEFHRRVRDGYLELAAQEPNRWKRIDASQVWGVVQDSLQKAILERLDEAGFVLK